MTTEINDCDPRAAHRHASAADWLSKLDDPKVGQDEVQAWLEWFEASDANRKAFEEIQLLRSQMGALPAGTREEFKRRTHVGEFGARRGNEAERSAVRARARLYALAAMLLAVTVGVGVWWSVQRYASDATYVSAESRHRTVTLDDGSSLVLGASSVVDVSYSLRQRLLTVQRGEAYFEVAHNKLRPFVVVAGDIRVTAVGTAFNVQRRADDVTVTVTEGQVRVSPGPSRTRRAATASSGEVLLAVGQQTVLPVESSQPVPTLQTAVVTPDWADGRASFINAPLREVLPVINRHASRRIEIYDPRVADLTYSGTVLRSHIDEWITSLPQVFPVRAVPLEDGTLTLVSAQPSVARQ